MTTRVRLYQDEDEGLHIDTDVEESELESYGVDVPDELVAVGKRVNAEWKAHQVELKEWWESTLPADDVAAERFAGVAFYEDRSWAELERFDGCLHAAAILSLAGANSWVVKCDICGEHVYGSRLKEENNAE